MIDNTKNELLKHISRYNKVVIWGLKSQYHTHRYIHSGFHNTLKKLGTPVVWMNYGSKHHDVINRGDLVISSYVQGRGVSEPNLPIKQDVHYCLHNFQEDTLSKINPKFLLNLQVYTSKAELSDQKWDEVTFFDTKTSTLYQPWGTNLLPEEFIKPTFNNSHRVFWIGSIWNNALNQGNIQEINQLKQALLKRHIKFTPSRFVPDWLSIYLIRRSRLAPAIAGNWQVENNYLPCRMFKNISYGQLGFSNVKKFDDLLKGCNIKGENIEELVEKALALSKKDYLSIIEQQQEVVKKHTYLHKMLNILKALLL